MRYLRPGQSYETTAVNFPPNQVGTIGLRILDDAGGVVTARLTAGIIETPAGSGHYAKTLVAPLLEGEYTALWDSDAGGVANQFNSAADVFTVTANAAAVVSPAPGASDPARGPCQAWVTSAQVATACGVGAPAIDYTASAVWASQLLFELSGRRFSGLCERMLRPCRQGCGCWLPASWGLPGGASWGWDGALWRSASNGRALECGCGCTQRVRLPYPARSIGRVRIAGGIVDPASYRIDEQRWLVRLAGWGGWPLCQDMSLADGAPGTFDVTVTYGAPPPVSGVEAARALACELYKLTHPAAGECKLPTGVTQIIRQGVTITKQAQKVWTDGQTGIIPVDAFLAAYNPKGRRRRGRVWSPDVDKTAKRAGG